MKEETQKRPKNGLISLLRLMVCGMAMFVITPYFNHLHALEAGSAKIEITAPIGTPLNGYGDRMGRDSIAVHDPLWARTVFLDDGQTKMFLVSVDLVAVNPELRQRVVELYEGEVPKENIIIVATHTHNGHGAMVRSIPIRFVSGRFIPEVLEATASKIVESMKLAHSARVRAAMGYVSGKSQGLSVNRRYSDGPVEEQIGVIKIEDSEGKPISIITNFTGHPTSIGDEDKYAFSADYPGYYYQEMESLAGPECVPLFLNGALGNQTISGVKGKSGWERTEAVGRQVARIADELSKTIAYGDVVLKLACKTAVLPLTLAASLQPEAVLLYSLEINDLMISFFPGEPCVELALNLRNRALSRGYEAHWSVGLANDYIMYFVPRHLYPDITYESSMNFFGPGIEDWFYREFEGMMPRKMLVETVEPALTNVEEHAGQVDLIQGVKVVDLSGAPKDIGAARGAIFRDGILKKYTEEVLDPVEKGKWFPDGSMWNSAPPFINIVSLALPMLGMGSRALLKGISMEYIQEMEAMAENAQLPFDGLWLLQNARMYSRVNDKTRLFSAPLCTMIALTGERVKGSGLLVGRNLDWEGEEENVVIRTNPDEGIPFVEVGFDWNVGLFTGMNRERIFVGVEYVRYVDEEVPNQAPVEFILGEVIRKCSGFNQALDILKNATYLKNYHVLLAGYESGKPAAAVVEYGNAVKVRMPDDGMLLGVDPQSTSVPEETKNRYMGLYEKIKDVQTMDSDFLRKMMTEPSLQIVEDMSQSWNRNTHHCVIANMDKPALECVFPNEKGEAGELITVALPGEDKHE